MDARPVEGDLGKLRWRCRRGMKELDLLLTRYVEEDYLAATPEQQAAFRDLLDSQDPLLYAYFLGRESPSDPVLGALIERITGTARTPVKAPVRLIESVLCAKSRLLSNAPEIVELFPMGSVYRDRLVD